MIQIPLKSGLFSRLCLMSLVISVMVNILSSMEYQLGPVKLLNQLKFIGGAGLLQVLPGGRRKEVK